MICPRDNIALIPRKQVELQLHICELCHGMWFQRKDLDKIKQYTNIKGNGVSNESPKVQHDKSQEVAICPVDRKRAMKQIVINEVHVDICSEHKGIWLDGGEIDLIIKNQRTNLSTTGEAIVNTAGDFINWADGAIWIGDILIEAAKAGADVAEQTGKVVLDVVASPADIIDL